MTADVRADVSEAVYIENIVIPMTIQITAKIRPIGLFGDLSPYLKTILIVLLYLYTKKLLIKIIIMYVLPIFYNHEATGHFLLTNCNMFFLPYSCHRNKSPPKSF